ncbi:hypothetical protein FIV34_17865 [Luteibacter pinisoli]|uniref:Sel1 repeat family protein n=1 Tax=Luteibacter pinisoli TaxID=2589080 RepID=A0A4Y5Z7K5_9GAMM|nr:hypothetical protein [Luteibacter pinisoli]QDE40946.1 hypothetical protein FIV34_17865 [Luteibacter pinisoli]
MSVQRIAALAALCLAAGGAFAGERPTPLPDQKRSTVAEALQLCPTSLERFIPGEYYFCDAARDFWSGRDGSARESLKNAAAWASKPAQYALGVMYFNGDHAEKNRPLGLAWLALAAERHSPDYEPAFVDAYGKVSPQELAQANAYWQDLKKTYGDDVAATRAKNRFDRAYRDLAWAVDFGGSVFMDGVTGFQMTNGVNFSDAAYGSSGFSLGRFLQTREAVALEGWRTNVYVGDAQLVPIADVVKRTPTNEQN